MTGHLLTLDSLGPEGFRLLLDLGHRAKVYPHTWRRALDGKKVGMIFDKPSTRTRVSLEAAAWALGMLPIVLRPDELQLGRGETIADTARVLSRYLDALTVRTLAQARIEELAEHSTIPVINALTDDHHPCQAIADVLTLEEEYGALAGCRVAFVGDGNNVCHSLMEAAGLAGFGLTVATPRGYEPSAAIVQRVLDRAATTGAEITLTDDPRAAVEGADVVYTDVWASMGKEDEIAERRRTFAGYRVDDALMNLAARHAIFLHCLPAHRGEEVDDDVIDGPRSRVWNQAENRLPTETAVFYSLITGDTRGERLA